MSDAASPWYHGSPQRLRVLRSGSTVTPDRHLAETFSHKPSLVCLEDDGTIRHDGRREGWLHVIDEPLRPDDLTPHPRTSMAPGLEWLTARPLRLRVIGAVPLDPDELLDDATLAELRRLAGSE
jgi:hypothetical protein